MSAASLGRAAGMLLLSPSLNPFPVPSADESAWEKAWRVAVVEVLALKDQERRRKVSVECSGPDDFALVKTPNWRA